MTSLDITSRAMNNHAEEEDAVEPGERAIEARDETPGEGEEEVA